MDMCVLVVFREISIISREGVMLWKDNAHAEKKKKYILSLYILEYEQCPLCFTTVKHIVNINNVNN